jgi:hypothetical protein
LIARSNWKSLTFTETLLTLEVTVATVFFLLLPIVSQLKAEKVYLSQGYFDDLRTILLLFLTQIGALLAAMYLQYPPVVTASASVGNLTTIRPDLLDSDLSDILRDRHNGAKHRVSPIVKDYRDR